MPDKRSAQDPKGLIFEAYRIEGITKPECRTIFLDWALSIPDATQTIPVIKALLATYAPTHPDHPMTAVMTEGLAGTPAPRRRGGWRARARDGKKDA